MYKKTMQRLARTGVIGLIFVFLSPAKAFSKIAYFDYAYINKKGICVYSAKEKKEVLVSKRGEEPQLSPDGTRLAYTFSPTKDTRKILVVNLLTGRRDTLKNNSTNCYGPVWSPDGSAIAFNIFINNTWFIGTYGIHNRIFNLSQNIKTSPGVFNPAWSKDGKLIFAHDLYNLYAFNTQCKIISKAAISTFLKSPNFSSADKFQWITPDSLIIETDLVNAKFPMGLHRALILVVKKNKTQVLTPPNYSCSNFFASKGFIYMDGIKLGSFTKEIYRVDYARKKFGLFKHYCNGFSARTD
jgi:dipeptidyl aminopeptidase/acylaminoacyl peptidase